MTLEFTSPTNFRKTFIETKNKLVPIKKYILAQTTQILLQKAYGAIMLRSRLRNSFLKEKYSKSKKAYNKQRNSCVKIFKSKKKNTFKKINLSEITDNKKFWKTVSPLFGHKVKTNYKMNLIEKMFYQPLLKRLLKYLKNISMKYFDAKAQHNTK